MIKTILLIVTDFALIKKKAKVWGKLLVIVARLIQVFIYFLLLSIIGIFHIPILFI